MRPPSEMFPKGRLITDPVELMTYETDAGLESAVPDAVVLPETTAEVAALVVWAAEHGVPLVARGAGTGLAGGAVARGGGVVVALTRMAHIDELDTVGRTATVESGAVNLDFESAVRKAGLYYPPDPASGRSCLIGGNLGTNAGGPHCFKYGVTTNYVTGLEVVLADGTTAVLGGRALDYPEYDLAGLVVGSEGTLAIVTRAFLRLLSCPPAVRTLMVSFDSLEAAGDAVSAIIAAGLVPATLEAIDQAGMKVIEDYCHAGLPVAAGAALIVEVDGYPESLDGQTAKVIEVLNDHGAGDLRVASTEKERERIWFGRKSAAGAMSRLAPNYYLSDITVRRSRLAAVLARIREICSDCDLATASFFHAGDGNLHPLILCDVRDRELMGRVHRALDETIELCLDENGTVSGEHGIGLEKRGYLARMYGPSELGAMRDVKLAFDPLGTLNPGKVLPDQIGHRQGAVPVLPRGSVFEPRTVEEAASGLAALTRAGRRVRIGSGANASPSGAELLLSTAGLSGVIDFAPEDLYVTVGAGTPLSDLESRLDSRGLLSPVSSPWSGATVGSVVATNLSGPQRLRYGGVRDAVLAVTVALADGRVLRVGRPLVKNVAGYDLPKVFVGSHGTLGLMADVTLKLVPAPQSRRSVAAVFSDTTAAVELGQAVVSAARVASAVVVAPGVLGSATGTGSQVLVYTAEGLPEDVDAELEAVREAWRSAGVAAVFEPDRSGNEIWADYLSSSGGRRIVVRAGVPAKSLHAFVIALDGPVEAPLLVDCAAGHCFAVLDPTDPERAGRWLASLRAAALALGGYAVAAGVPEGMDLAFDRWGYRPQALEVMRRLKARWDPAGILGAGSFILG